MITQLQACAILRLLGYEISEISNVAEGRELLGYTFRLRAGSTIFGAVTASGQTFLGQVARSEARDMVVTAMGKRPSSLTPHTPAACSLCCTISTELARGGLAAVEAAGLSETASGHLRKPGDKPEPATVAQLAVYNMTFGGGAEGREPRG